MQIDTSYRSVVIPLLLAGLGATGITGCSDRHDGNAKSGTSAQALAADDSGVAPIDAAAAGSGGQGGGGGASAAGSSGSAATSDEADAGDETDAGIAELDGGAEGDADGGPSEPAVPEPGPMRDAGANALTDRQVGAVMTSLNTAEVLLSRLASRRGSAQAVVDYAARMATEHSAANGRLARMLSNVGISRQTNPLSQSIIVDNNDVVRTLTPLSGTAFDSAFMAAQVNSHTMAIATVDDTLMPAAQTPLLRDELVTLRAMLAEHLAAAAAIGQ
jgi:putative membrane protein